MRGSHSPTLATKGKGSAKGATAKPSPPTVSISSTGAAEQVSWGGARSTTTDANHVLPTSSSRADAAREQPGPAEAVDGEGFWGHHTSVADDVRRFAMSIVARVRSDVDARQGTGLARTSVRLSATGGGLAPEQEAALASYCDQAAKLLKYRSAWEDVINRYCLFHWLARGVADHANAVGTRQRFSRSPPRPARCWKWGST